MDLTGKLLIAMPGMGDPRFEKSVVFMCAHSAEGAMGLIVNKPAPEIRFTHLLEQLSIDLTAPGPLPEVHFGGPVEHGRGFVLHSGEYGTNPATLRVDHRFGMTATLDVLEDIAAGKGPGSCLLALGYAGWGPGQVEGELKENAWLVGEADESVVFSRNHTGQWGAALSAMGIDPVMLSGAAGRA